MSELYSNRNLADYLSAAEMSQSKAADRLKVNHSFISYATRGERGLARDNAIGLSEILHVKPEELAYFLLLLAGYPKEKIINALDRESGFEVSPELLQVLRTSAGEELTGEQKTTSVFASLFKKYMEAKAAINPELTYKGLVSHKKVGPFLNLNHSAISRLASGQRFTSTRTTDSIINLLEINPQNQAEFMLLAERHEVEVVYRSLISAGANTPS